MQQSSLTDIPLEIWRGCIFEYWIGPIHQVQFNTNDGIIKFKSDNYSRIVGGLDLMTVRTIHRICCLTSKRLHEIFVEEMNDFWKKVSNVLEMVVYWKRYESSRELSLARGDMSVLEGIDFVKTQKLIEATEMNLNREYDDIIDPSMCSSRYYTHDKVDLKAIKNEFNTHEVNKEFEHRIEKLMISDEKFEKILSIAQLDAYDLFLHKAHILSLDMISHFDSEKYSGYYSNYDSFENCCLISEGLFTKGPSDSKALGLMINLDEVQDLSIFNQVTSNYIAVAIRLNEWGYAINQLPSSVQYLCLQVGQITYFDELGAYYKDLLEEIDVFPNVRDITIQMDSYDDFQYAQYCEIIEKNIISAVTRKRFPKLIRISLQGFSKIETFLDFELLNELLYVEIIPRSRDHEYNTIPNWSERKVHNLISHRFIEHDPLLLHHLIVHANMSAIDYDAKYESIEEYYTLCKNRFVPSISHSSFNEYYDKCYE